MSDLETTIEVSNRRSGDLEKIIEKIKKDNEIERVRANEELEIEREKVYQLQRMEIQMQQFKKKAEDLSNT